MTGKGSGSKIVTCPQCRRYYRLTLTPRIMKGSFLRCSGCRHVFHVKPVAPLAAAAESAPLVLVGTDGNDLRGLIGAVLEEEGLPFRAGNDGGPLWDEIRRWRPRVAIIDVGLPGVPAFEVCDRVRGEETVREMGIILVASVFRKTRYKRSPTSLYGADDYIEKHHIRSDLAEKIRRFLPGSREKAAAGEKPPPSDGVTRLSPDQEKEAQRLRKKEEARIESEEHGGTAPPAGGDTSREADRLKRFARIIISDIALYNQDAVEEGVREGTLLQLLHGEIEEGRRLYMQRVPPGNPAAAVHYRQALEEFIRRKKEGR